MKQFRLRAGFGAAALPAALILAAGCALHEVEPPPPPLPTAFAAPPVGSEASRPGKTWYQEFGSAELSALSAARARVAQADARARQAGAAILPSVDAGANGNYLAGHSVNGSAHETDWAVLLSASYEVDFWGKNRATARSASRLASASRADRDTVALTTLAGVANAYFQVLSLRERLVIAASNLNAAQKLLDIIQARFDVGLSNPVELASQKAALATAGLVIPDLERQEAEALAALALLVGRAPEQFSVQARNLDALREPAIGSGLPAELLTRRPDIFMAEANLKAANADLVAARAALFPSLSL